MPRRVPRYVQAHPFLVTFVSLALWTTAIATVGYISNQARIDDIQKVRADRALLVTETDIKLCRKLNVFAAKLRSLALTDPRINQRLGVPANMKLTPAVVRKVARTGTASERQQAHQIVSFLAKFAAADCKQLPSQRITTPQDRTSG